MAQATHTSHTSVVSDNPSNCRSVNPDKQSELAEAALRVWQEARRCRGRS